MKTFITLRDFVALVAVFVFLSFSGCSRTPADNIERVLNLCAQVSKDAGALRRDPATTAGYVADHFQAINASACPEDFRAAYQAHVNAWRQAQAEATEIAAP